MSNPSAIRLVSIFVLTFSLIVFPASVSADPAPLRTTPGTQWSPAGPSIDQLQITVYSDELEEYQALQGRQIDIPDWNAPATVINTLSASGSGFYLTAPNSEYGMFDIDFNHANTFFGIPFSLGHDGVAGAQCPSNDCTTAAINFRQGIAHLIDKAAFITVEPVIQGHADSLDNSLPPSQGILHSGLPLNAQNPPSSPTCTPLPSQACASGTATGSYTTTAVDATGASSSVTVGGVCGWDLLNAAHVAAGQTCKSAYKYGIDDSQNGIVCAFNPCGTTSGTTNPDFCDAAAHWVAAGLGTGVSTTDCHLLGFAPLAGGASSITFVVRSDSSPLLLLGDTLGNRMCELINGAFTPQPCSQIVLTPTQTIVQAHSTVLSTKTVLLDWHMYTASWRLGSQFDQLFALYNSAFSSSGCNPAQRTEFFGQDYIYWCNADYDAATNAMEFANSYSVAVQQAQLAMDVFGSHVATIPVWSERTQFGYLKGWTNVNDATGVGPPNYFTLLNAWNKTAAIAGTLRMGLKEGTVNLNPYLFTTPEEGHVVHEVYDSLLAIDQYNPNPTTLFGWMVNSFALVNPTDIRMVLKPNIFFHDGTRVTANDVKFSLLSFQQAGGSVAGAVADVNDVSVISSPPGQYSIFDISLLHPSPFAEFNIGGVPIVPSHVWSVCATTTPAPAGCTSGRSTPCMTKGTNACTLNATLLSGNAADPLCITDPANCNHHYFIGSGPFMCVDLGSGQIGGGCTQTSAGGPGTQAVTFGGKIILQRTGFGFGGTDATHSYFRGSAQWKQWLWADSANIGTVNVLNDLSAVEVCAGKPASTTGCGHFDTTAVYLANPFTGAPCTTASPNCQAPCTLTAGSCNPLSESLGGNNDGLVDGTEVSQVETNALQTWNPGVISYDSFTGKLPTTGTVYEGGISYCQFPLPSGATCP